MISKHKAEGDVFKEDSMVHAMHLEPPPSFIRKIRTHVFEGGDLRMSWAYKSFLY